MKYYVLIFSLLFSFSTRLENFNNLPGEIRALILSNTSLADIKSFCRTSSTMMKICRKKNQILWQALVRRDIDEYLNKPADTSWKEIYYLFRATRGTPKTLSAGVAYTCAIKADGMPQCWGMADDNEHAAFANNSELNAISVGGAHVCVINKNDELIKCSGDNSFGQLLPPFELGRARTLSSGDNHTCAISRENSKVYCWGLDSDGQSSVPAELKAKEISSGGEFTCAISIEGNARCWGNNAHGQREVPADLGKVKSVSSGTKHACAITVDGKARCWGDNRKGQAVVPELGEVKEIASGGLHTCAILADRQVRCWGDNSEGQSSVPADLGAVIAITSGHEHNCAHRLDDGTLRCWGDNSAGASTVPYDLGKVKK
jgi:alpha-tubulin suppressor-like RCC1 family protein